MNAKLKDLINNADDGQSDALTLMPDTLKKILQELEKMCHSSNTILAEPVAGGPGFKISVKQQPAVTASTYELQWSDTDDTAYEDFWDITTADGGQDDVGDPLFPTYDSVSWKGTRLVQRTPTSIGFLVEHTTGNSIGEFFECGTSILSRKITVDSTGKIVKIGPEFTLPGNDYVFLQT